VFVRNYPRRSRPRVQIAKAAITGEYVTQMVARLECRQSKAAGSGWRTPSLTGYINGDFPQGLIVAVLQLSV